MTTLSISENREDILNSYEKLLKSPDHWVIYSYAGSSKTQLEVVASGDDGLDGLSQQFIDYKIMYAFCMVEDPKTTLNKLVFINWQGPDVGGLMRGRAANHLNDIYRLFKGGYLKIHATSEDDVDPELLLAEVSRASSTTYSFKTDKPFQNEITPQEPIGTNYKPINPTAIATPQERQQFWSKNQQEEQERKKAHEISIQKKNEEIEKERKLKEKESEKRRNQIIKQKQIEISKIDKPQDVISNGESGVATNSCSVSQSNTSLNSYSSDSGKVSGKESNISPRSNTSNNNSNTSNNPFKYQTPKPWSAINRSNNTNPDSQVRSSISQFTNTINSLNKPTTKWEQQQKQKRLEREKEIQIEREKQAKIDSENKILEEQQKRDKLEAEMKAEMEKLAIIEAENNKIQEEIRLAAVKKAEQEALQKEKLEKEKQAEIARQEQVRKDAELEKLRIEQEQKIEQEKQAEILRQEQEKQQDLLTQNEMKSQNNESNGEIKAQAMYDYEAEDDTEISFLPGDVITEIDQFDEGWWTGRAPDGKVGMFPANYVQVLNL